MAIACRKELAALLSLRAVTGRPGARQWKFFKDAVEKILSPGYISGFDSMPPTQAAQYKFEVEARLRRHYLRTSRPALLVFSLVHERDLPLRAVPDQDTYPRLAGYCVLIGNSIPGSL